MQVGVPAKNIDKSNTPYLGTKIYKKKIRKNHAHNSSMSTNISTNIPYQNEQLPDY